MKRGTDNQLFTAIQKGLPGTDMPATKLTDDQTWQAVAFIRALAMPAAEMPVAGDVEAGRTIFYGKGGCTACHMVRGQGGSLGPDLTNAGAQRSVVYLRESIYDPNARISEGFQAAEVTLKSGAKLEGVLKDKTNYFVQLLDKKGQLHLLDAGDLSGIVIRKNGWMPEIKDRLDKTEMDNLLAFLAHQAIREPAKRERKAR